MGYTPKMKIRHYDAQNFGQGCNSPALPLRSQPQSPTSNKYENSTVRKGGFLYIKFKIH